jgi:hypothetical protein
MTMAAARRRMGAHASVAPRAELLAARIRIDLELAAQASFRTWSSGYLLVAEKLTTALRHVCLALQ